MWFTGTSSNIYFKVLLLHSVQFELSWERYFCFVFLPPALPGMRWSHHFHSSQSMRSIGQRWTLPCDGVSRSPQQERAQPSTSLTEKYGNICIVRDSWEAYVCFCYIQIGCLEQDSHCGLGHAISVLPVWWELPPGPSCHQGPADMLQTSKRNLHSQYLTAEAALKTLNMSSSCKWGSLK